MTVTKRKALTLALILAVLFSAVAGTQLVNLATANPTWGPDFPREPDITSPTIILHSPFQNQTFNSTNISLNFTVVKPEIWFKENSNLWVLGKVTAVSYEVDGGEKQSLIVHDTTTYNVKASTYPPRNLNFSLSLILPEGTHNITIGVEAESYYVTLGYLTGPPLSLKVQGAPELVNFTVAQPEPEVPEKEPFSAAPVTVASVAAVAVIAIGLLFYFKRLGR